MSGNKIAVIGTVFMDIKGFAHGKYDPVGTNIGDVQFFHGGVGRNAAENLANIGLPVSFLSTVDVGASGDEIISALEAKGVDTRYILRTKERGMGMWLAVLDCSGELCGSISQQPDLSLFEKYIDSVICDAVRDCSCVVLEIDMTKEIANRVIIAAEKAQKPVYALVGNMSVILENKEMLRKTACFICNNIEAGRLVGEDYSVATTEILLNNIKQIAQKHGIKSLVITNGAEGAVYYDSILGKTGHQCAVETTVIDSTGAGDAFFSGTVGALSKGFEIDKACEYGAVLASKVIALSQSSAEPCIDFFE